MRISDWSSDVCSSDLLVRQAFQRIARQGVPLVRTQDQAHGRIFLGKRPMLFRVVAIQVHLAYVGMGQRAELQVDDDQKAQLAMEEQQIDAITSLFDRSEERRVGKEGVRRCRSRW